MDTSTFVARANTLAILHAAGHPLVLPTVWDVSVGADGGGGRVHRSHLTSS